MTGEAANMLLNMTSSMRFEGPLNVDLNELTMNLVPYPRLHFLQSSMSPLVVAKDMGKQMAGPRAMDQVTLFRVFAGPGTIIVNVLTACAWHGM